MSPPEPAPAERFTAELRGLYEAAGAPEYRVLVKQAAGQRPPVKVSDSSLSDWLAGKSTPASPAAVRFLVQFLQGRLPPGTGRRAPLATWLDWHRQAQADRRRRRGGDRPGTPATGIGSAAGPPGAAPVDEPPALPSPARSTYLEQVRRIAPPELLGREDELAELARFCLAENQDPYVWWRAGPWAGKSALMSAFVLDPPAPVAQRVRIVSFFITARLAAQDTREAFTVALLGQLEELTGRRPQVIVDEATRETALLVLLRQAAADLHARGGRLVLLVDGLDEDRGDTVGPHAHSIAALLPGVPPDGMRVIVTGRPNPPIPDDVPDWHPLRAPGIVRELTDSPHARDLQRLGRSELRRLLKGTEVEQDLLGLLTAARGGLSGADLHSLTGAELVHIEDVLHTVSGRTFTRRPDLWGRETGPEVYLLGHEELHTTACRYLGAGRLTGYRDRLNAWARRYAAREWPEDSPAYLLSGYSRMLHTVGDTDTLVALVLDRHRHDRMLDLTGGDAAAGTEIVAAQDLALRAAEPDVLVLARLCMHRGRLADRNARLPLGLPAVWATLGRPARAESLVDGITDPYLRAQAAVEVAGAMAAAGDVDRAELVAGGIAHHDLRSQAAAAAARAVAAAGDVDRAERIARAMPAPDQRAQLLVELAQACAGRGDPDRAQRLAAAAERITRTIPDVDDQAQPLLEIAKAAAATGDADRAERIARTILDPHRRPWALTEVARAVATAGDGDRAERIARTITRPDQQTQALVAVAQAVAATGDFDRAERIARSGPGGPYQPGLAGIARAVAVAGDLDRAERVARGITDPLVRAQAWITIAQAGAATGGTARAGQLRADAARLVDTITAPGEQAQVHIAQVLAAAGQVDRAERIARSVTGPYQPMQALAEVATTVAAAGDCHRAGQIAHAIADPGKRAQTLTEIARVAAAGGDVTLTRRLIGEVQRIAGAIVDPGRQVRTLTTLARATAGCGHDWTGWLIDRAEQASGLLVSSRHQAQALFEVARVAVAAADFDRAERIARAISYPRGPWAVAEIAQLVAAAGDLERAERIASDIADPGARDRANVLRMVEVAKLAAADGNLDRAEHVAGVAGDPQAVTEVAVAIAATGDFARAERIVRAVSEVHPPSRVAALAEVAAAVAGAGGRKRAGRLAAEAEGLLRKGGDPGHLSRARGLAEVARATAAAGNLDHAERLARAITDPGERSRALTEVARASAAAGDLDHAERLARTITDPGKRSRALTEVARASAAAGDVVRADHIAGSLRKEVRALAEVARAVAAAGDLDHAERLARTITDPAERSRALSEIATVCDPAAARRLLAQAFAEGPWLVPIPGLARLWPDLVLALTEDLYGEERRRTG